MRIRHLFAVSLLLVAAIGLVGCNPFAQQYQTINDPNAAFHLEAPAKWSSLAEPGLITLYGADKLPAQDAAIDAKPWFFIYSTVSTETADLGKRVSALADQRSESRGWTKTDFGTPKNTELGGQPASEMTIAATDEQGRSFEGVLVLGRSGSTDVLVFGFAEPGAFDQKSVDDLKKRFYWHSSGDSESTDPSGTTDAKTQNP